MIGQKCRWLDRDDDGTSARARGGHGEMGPDYRSYHPFLSIGSVSSSQTKPVTILRGSDVSHSLMLESVATGERAGWREECSTSLCGSPV